MKTHLPFATAAALLLAWTGCAKPPAPEPPKPALQVQVTSDPGKAALSLAGKPLGETPRTLALDRIDELVALTASLGSEEVVEKRIRFLSPTRVEVAFTFGAGRSALAKVLGMPRILVFDYGAGVTFDLNKADLKPDFLPLLDRQAALLKAHFPDLAVTVCGHTDSAGARDHNLSLSLGRAEAVAKELAARGVARARVKVQGFGSQYPVADNAEESGRAQNRRTEVVLPQ